MLSLTEENYLKAIYHLSDGGVKSVTTNELAEAMNTKPASVTDMVKKLSDEGNVIGSHTWDHHMVSKYSHNSTLKIIGKNGKITTKPVDDWVTQIDKPTKKLEEITGKKMDYFAYPFGIWNKAALPELKKRGFKAAFQLADKRDPIDPLMTIRRIIASGFWTAKNLSNSIRGSFK